MMAEWHVPPDYIVNNWTDELLDLMAEKLAERREREREAATADSPVRSQQVGVSAEALAARSRGMIQVVKEK